MAISEERKKEIKEAQRKSGLEIGKKNLHPINTLDKDKQLEICKKGAQATNELKKRKKDIKTICNDLLGISALDIAKDIIDKDILDKLKSNDIDVTLYDLIVIKQIEKAISEKNTKAAEFVRDSSGDKPTDKIESDINVISESDKQLIKLLNDRIDVLEGLHNNTIIDQSDTTTAAGTQ